MKTKIALVGITAFCLTGGGAYAAPAISGFVQTSYNFNITNPDSTASNGGYHAYDAASKTFMLNAAHLAFKGSEGDVGYNVETDFGTDAHVNEPWIPGVDLFDVQEAFLTYAFGADKMWGLKAGKYATYEGIEVVEGGANPTISRGLIYWLAEPVTHTGVEASYSAKMWDLHIGLVNGWDRVVDNNTMPTFLAKLGLNMGDPLALTISTLMGSEVAPGNMKNMRSSYDVTGVTKLVPMVDLWFQVNYGMEAKASLTDTTATGALSGKDASWLGFGIQPLVHVNEAFAVGLRFEFFSDMNGARVATTDKLERTLMNFSVAPAYSLTKNLVARAEYRMDMSDQKDFDDGSTGRVKSQSIISADLIASF